MGEGIAFPDTDFPVPHVYIYYVSDIINVWDTVSIFIPQLPWMFLPTDIVYFNNGLNNIQWASYISDLRTRLRIISRRVPGFVTGSACGVWGREWTTCLLNDGLLLSLCSSKWQLVYYCTMVERIFLSLSCLSVFVHYPNFACYFSSPYIFYTQK